MPARFSSADLPYQLLTQCQLRSQVFLPPGLPSAPASPRPPPDPCQTPRPCNRNRINPGALWGFDRAPSMARWGLRLAALGPGGRNSVRPISHEQETGQDCSREQRPCNSLLRRHPICSAQLLPTAAVPSRHSGSPASHPPCRYFRSLLLIHQPTERSRVGYLPFIPLRVIHFRIPALRSSAYDRCDALKHNSRRAVS